MELIQAIILGIIQGLTEFLPISSSGHLVLFQNFFGYQESNLFFDIVVHLGTLCSVITIYRNSLSDIFMNSLKDIGQWRSKESKIISLVIVATIPTAIIGLLFKDLFESLFSNMIAVGIGFLITATLLIFVGKKKYSVESKDFLNLIGLNEIKYKSALIIGLAQGLAITPGISRSGTTIAVALILGLKGQIAAGFSFMLAIPAILGAVVLSLRHLPPLDINYIYFLISGFVSSYISGLIGLSLVLKAIKKGRIERFSYYLILLGIGTILFGVFR